MARTPGTGLGIFGNRTSNSRDIAVERRWGRAVERPPHRPGSRLVSARRAAETKVDPARMQGGERPELLRHLFSGEWLGSMIPPAPIRIVDVPAATWASATAVAALAMPGIE